MTSAQWFWLFLVGAAVFGFVPFEGPWARVGLWGRGLLWWALFGLLGWATFGSPLK